MDKAGSTRETPDPSLTPSRASRSPWACCWLPWTRVPALVLAVLRLLFPEVGRTSPTLQQPSRGEWHTAAARLPGLGENRPRAAECPGELPGPSSCPAPSGSPGCDLSWSGLLVAGVTRCGFVCVYSRECILCVLTCALVRGALWGSHGRLQKGAPSGQLPPLAQPPSLLSLAEGLGMPT